VILRLILQTKKSIRGKISPWRSRVISSVRALPFLLGLAELCHHLGLVPSPLRRATTAVRAPYLAELLNGSALPVAACGL